MKSVLILLIIAFLSYETNGSKITSLDIWKRFHQPPARQNSFRNDAETTNFFDVRLDHFNSQDTRTWRMRYRSNDQFYAMGGPIFIMVGGEWTIDSGFNWLQEGHMYDMARQYRGYMFYTEHRYYGESRPTPNTSLENMRWNTVDQALADLAAFIVYIKAQIPSLANSKVILVGGSYAASVVTWMKQKYPNLITGVWASSGPILAKVDFYEYLEIMGQATRDIGGQNCYNRIEEAFAEMESLVWLEEVGRINQEFNLCPSLDPTNQNDVWNFFFNMMLVYSGVVQYYFDGEIERACQIITDPQYRDGLAGYGAFIRAVNGPNCLDLTYKTFINDNSNLEWGSVSTESSIRQWIYQLCSSLAYYQTTTSKNQPFGSNIPLDYHLAICKDVYDGGLFNNQTIYENVRAFNLKYGGLDPKVTNVYFTHGDVDPWKALGIQEDYNESSPADVIPFASHCNDLFSQSSRDIPSMRAVKERITELVGKWINE